MKDEARIQTTCLLTLTIMAVAAALYVLRTLMIPFVLALFFTFALIPIIDILQKRLRIPRPLAIFFTLILGIVIIGVFSLLVSASITEMVSNAGSYQEHVKGLLNRLTASLPLERFGLDPKKFISPILDDLGTNAGNVIKETVNSVIGIFSNVTLILIFTMFLLVGTGSARGRSKNMVWENGEAKIKKYISAKLVLSSLLGLLVGLTLYLLGVKLAIVFGLFALILNFIPSIGPVIATLLPLPVILMNPEFNLTIAILAIVVPGTIQFIFGNVIEMKVMGDSLDLHPVTVLMSLIFWGMLWGIAGMFLAVPMTAVLKMILEESELTKPAANMLAGRID